MEVDRLLEHKIGGPVDEAFITVGAELDRQHKKLVAVRRKENQSRS